MAVFRIERTRDYITSEGQKSNRTDSAKGRKIQTSAAVTHQRWSRWLRTQV